MGIPVCKQYRCNWYCHHTLFTIPTQQQQTEPEVQNGEPSHLQFRTRYALACIGLHAGLHWQVCAHHIVINRYRSYGACPPYCNQQVPVLRWRQRGWRSTTAESTRSVSSVGIPRPLQHVDYPPPLTIMDVGWIPCPYNQWKVWFGSQVSESFCLVPGSVWFLGL